MYKAWFYVDRKGVSGVDIFLKGLEKRIHAKMFKWIDVLDREGPNLYRPYAGIVEGKIRELRMSFGTNEYRLLYFFDDKNIIITNGFQKKTDRVPYGEIFRAKRAMADYFRDKEEML